MGDQSTGVQSTGCRVQGSGFRVQGSGFRVQGSGLMYPGQDGTSRHARQVEHFRVAEAPRRKPRQPRGPLRPPPHLCLALLIVSCTCTHTPGSNFRPRHSKSPSIHPKAVTRLHRTRRVRTARGMCISDSGPRLPPPHLHLAFAIVTCTCTCSQVTV